MSYVTKKLRLFKTSSDQVLESRRSEARLKTYSSAVDVRAWCGVVEDRRQHILELITKGKAHCFGKLIPLEAIIDAVCSNKNAGLSQCEEMLAKLWKLIDNLDLSDEDKQRVNALRYKSAKSPTRSPHEGISPRKLPTSPGSLSAKTSQKNIPSAKTSQKGAASSKQGLDKSPSSRIPQKTSIKQKLNLKELRDGGIDVDSMQPTSWRNKEQGPSRITTKGKLPIKDTTLTFADDLQKKLDSVPDKTKSLQEQLSANECLCKDLQANCKCLLKERDQLQKKLAGCLEELQRYKEKGDQGIPLHLQSSCSDEVRALEAEIEIMRNGNPSPEEEAAMIQKEVNMLKKYCTKLSGIEIENERLKRHRDELNATIEKFDVDKIDNIPNVEMIELKDKLLDYDQLVNERNILKEQVEKMGLELLQYSLGGTSGTNPISASVESLIEERNLLAKRLEELADAEEELYDLRAKAERVDELEKELELFEQSGKETDMEVRRSKSKCCNLERELHNVVAENEAMNKRICCMKQENDQLKSRAREYEMLKLERDRLQIRLNETQQMHEEVLSQLNHLDQIRCEKDMYKKKFEEISSVECECNYLKEQLHNTNKVYSERDQLLMKVHSLEGCICDQEEEIRCMISKVDDMSKSRDGKQDRMQDALDVLRAEVERKDHLIAESEQKLAAVQAQLKNSIKNVTCETGLLKSQCDQLQRDLKQAEAIIASKNSLLQEKDNCICDLDQNKKWNKRINKNELESVEIMRRELENAREENRKLQEIANKMMSLTGDEHVQNMIKQSECAVKRVFEELTKQYREWDKVKNRKKHKGLKIIAETNSVELLKEQLEEYKYENEKLQKQLKDFQNELSEKSDKSGDCSAKELFELKLAHNELQEKMKKETKTRQALEAKLKKR